MASVRPREISKIRDFSNFSARRFFQNCWFICIIRIRLEDGQDGFYGQKPSKLKVLHFSWHYHWDQEINPILLA